VRCVATEDRRVGRTRSGRNTRFEGALCGDEPLNALANLVADCPQSRPYIRNDNDRHRGWYKHAR